LVRAWQQLLGETDDARRRLIDPSRRGHAPVPVPADAVRVFRGRKIATTRRHGFVERLEQVFMPLTVQMQRLYGLTAYLPAVPPASDDPRLPDEVALVFYRIQGCYDDAKRSIGGRAYSELHELAFDMPASRSGFPQLLVTDSIVADRPYHLFERSVDWQGGGTRLYLGTRKENIQTDAFLAGVATAARQVQGDRRSLDAAIFVATDDAIVWWDHAPAQIADPVRHFDRVADSRWTSAPRRLRIPYDMTEPYAGLALNNDGDFVNFQFPRI
jgi:hypothetical protein